MEIILVHSDMLPIYREVCVSILGAQNAERRAKKSMGWNPWMSSQEVSERETGYYSRPSKRVVGRKPQ